MSSGGRFDISALQVIASVLAAVTGAIAASYLGIAGTIVGTAVMSVAGTAGSAIYRHYLGRGQEQLKNKAAQIVPKARDSSAGSALNRHRPATEAGAHAARPNGAAANGAGARAVAGETSDRGQSGTAGARRPGLADALPQSRTARGRSSRRPPLVPRPRSLLPRWVWPHELRPQWPAGACSAPSPPSCHGPSARSVRPCSSAAPGRGRDSDGKWPSRRCPRRSSRRSRQWCRRSRGTKRRSRQSRRPERWL